MTPEQMDRLAELVAEKAAKKILATKINVQHGGLPTVASIQQAIGWTASDTDELTTNPPPAA